jgi:hypothetical protein
MRILSFLCLKLLCGWGLFAQVGTVAGGGDGSSSSGSIAFSLGQIDYAAAANGSGAINAGVQQPYEVFVSAVDEDYLQFQMELFPNPSSDFLNLSIGEMLPNLHYQLYDLNGRMLSAAKITENQSQIDLQALPSATYFIHILDADKAVKTFKVVKK